MWVTADQGSRECGMPKKIKAIGCRLPEHLSCLSCFCTYTTAHPFCYREESWCPSPTFTILSFFLSPLGFCCQLSSLSLVLRTELCPPPKFICWSPSPQYDCILNRAFKDIIKINEVIRAGPGYNGIGVLFREDTRELPPSLPAIWRHREKGTASKPEQQSLPKSERTSTLTLDSPDSRIVRK